MTVMLHQQTLRDRAAMLELRGVIALQLKLVFGRTRSRPPRR